MRHLGSSYLKTAERTLPSEPVLLAAREALLRNRASSLADVASAAGVSRATLYRLFGSRDALLRAVELEPDPSTRERVCQVLPARSGPAVWD